MLNVLVSFLVAFLLVACGREEPAPPVPAAVTPVVPPAPVVPADRPRAPVITARTLSLAVENLAECNFAGRLGLGCIQGSMPERYTVVAEALRMPGSVPLQLTYAQWTVEAPTPEHAPYQVDADERGIRITVRIHYAASADGERRARALRERILRDGLRLRHVTGAILELTERPVR